MRVLSNSEITRLFQMITDEELSTGWEGPIWISKEDRSRLPRFEYIGNNQSGVADLCDTLLNTRPGCACSECTESCECGSSYVQNEDEVAVLRPGIPSVTGYGSSRFRSFTFSGNYEPCLSAISTAHVSQTAKIGSFNKAAIALCASNILAARKDTDSSLKTKFTKASLSSNTWASISTWRR